MSALIEVPARAKGHQRWVLLDMLRGIAVLLVLFRHHEAGGYLQAHGWIGVDLFFVLSGFLVSGLIFDEYRQRGNFDALRFLIRRGFKIYPSFHLFILASAALFACIGPHYPGMNHLAEVLFFQNYHEGLWDHTWSLAVEEHFYLVLVLSALLLIAFMGHFRWRTMVLSCVVLFLLFLALRVWTTVQEPFAYRTHMFRSHLRMDSLLAGVLLAAWHRYRPLHFHNVFGSKGPLLWCCMLLFVLPILLVEHGSFTFATIGFSGVYLAAAVAVGMAVTVDPHPTSTVVGRFVVRPLAWLGGVSYTTYLWHLFVLRILQLGTERIGLSGTVPEFLAFVALSVLVGAVLSWLVERPALALRDRWFPASGRLRV